MSKGKIKGRVEWLGQLQTNDKGFRKQEFAVVTEGEFPQKLKLEVQGDRTDNLSTMRVGEEVECDYDLRGRLWINKEGEPIYFNTIVCWRVAYLDRRGQNVSPPPPQPQAAQPQGQAFNLPTDPFNNDDDLPF